MNFDFDRVASAWDRGFAVREAAARPVSERLITVARIDAGAKVLDIGTGPGEPALTAARAAGKRGHVLGVDVSPTMVNSARLRAEREGLSNVRFAVSDGLANVPDGPYDAIISRWGMMFFADVEAVLRGIFDRLRPGGIFASATWGAPQDVPHLSVPMTLMRPTGAAPPNLARGPFALSDAAELLRRLRAVGFADAAVETMEITYAFDSASQYFAHVSDIAPPVVAHVASLDDVARAAFRGAVEATVTERFRAPDGTIRIPNSVLISSGRRPD